MIYTIGHTESYLKYHEELGDEFEKLGAQDEEGYTGGSVWQTIEGALGSCGNQYSVWGVDADWDKDTYPANEPDNSSMHYLVNTSKLIKL